MKEEQEDVVLSRMHHIVLRTLLQSVRVKPFRFLTSIYMLVKFCGVVVCITAYKYKQFRREEIKVTREQF